MSKPRVDPLRVHSEGTNLPSFLRCLRGHKNAGFGLKRFDICDNDERKARDMAEDFLPLVEVLEVGFPPVKTPTVNPIPIHQADMC